MCVQIKCVSLTSHISISIPSIRRLHVSLAAPLNDNNSPLRQNIPFFASVFLCSLLQKNLDSFPSSPPCLRSSYSQRQQLPSPTIIPFLVLFSASLSSFLPKKPSSTASGAFHNASTCAPQTSEEEHRIEDEYLEGGSFGESEFNGGSRKGKHMMEEEMEGLPGTRRMKKGPGNSKYYTLLDAFLESIVARKERDLARAEHYKLKYGDVTSSLTEEYSISDCMITLEATPGVGARSYTKALSFFPDIN
ncbi:unnamed protein product [Lactuca saligna]|uniref:Uncharacterized protein n=1 Tax=Lactuca saligna TaxID=75948 RepID=A0AA36A122_LACSI|nr:unnamed protein product [Lactuca saligna]